MKTPMIPRQDLLKEIAAFPCVETPCAGSIYSWKHFPHVWIDGQTREEGIRCNCGRFFDGHAWQAPSTQPSPELWSSFQQFKQHIAGLAQRTEHQEAE